MTTHKHDYPEPTPTIEPIVVSRVTFRRGTGCCDQSIARMVTAYHDEEGNLLFESDPVKSDALDPLPALKQLVDVLNKHPESYRLDSGDMGAEYVSALVRARAAVKAA